MHENGERNETKSKHFGSNNNNATKYICYGVIDCLRNLSHNKNMNLF